MLTIYSKETTSFSTLGYGVLKDFISHPLITEELNGVYTLEFEYAKNGYLSEYLIEQNIIKAKGQPFRIWNVKKDMNKITIFAKHIVFDLGVNFLTDTYPKNLTGKNALQWILDHASVQTNFTVTGASSTVASARYVRKSIIEALFNDDNALVDRFNCELSYDNFNIKVYDTRGSNSNFSIRYKKNLTGIDFNLDFSNVATRIVPIGFDGITIDSVYVESDKVNNYFTPLYKTYEFSNIKYDPDDEDAYHTLSDAKQALITAATDLFSKDVDLPKISISVNFIELSKCIEYENYSNLEYANLGDTVNIIIPELNINTTARIVKTVYDCILKRYTILEIGNIKSSITRSQITVENQVKRSESFLTQAQQNAESLINHPFNGNVLIDKEDGIIYLMDTNNPSTAQNVWKWSLGGLGFSSTGINGTYNVAITQDGKIVADFITTGTLSTDRIQGYQELVLTVAGQNNKISQVTQTVDELNSKISDISDITISGESNFATFTLDNINESEPIQIRVKPISDNISYLYPHSGLFPSNTTYLKVRTIRFHNNTTDEDIDYVLPNDLLIYDQDTYDEFYLDYDSQTCQVIKRCQYNADGTVSALTTEQIIDYPYPSIILSDGDYTMTLLGYEYGYLFVRLMAKNIYTSQFYTKSETDSRINQKADEIELGVTQTLSNYSDTAQMNAAIILKANEINSVVSTKVGDNEIISKINQTSESVTINANKVNLQGYVTATDLSGNNSTTINGSNITTGIIKSSNYAVNSAGTSINLSNGEIDTKNFKVSSTGDIVANGGKIGGYIITSEDLYGGKSGTSSNTGKYAFWAGETNNQHGSASTNAPFRVGHDGSLVASNAYINGTINAGSGSIGALGINSYGLQATDGDGYSVAIRPDRLYARAPGDTWEEVRWYILAVNFSDERVKNTIKDLDTDYEEFYNNLRPVSFRFNKKVRPDDYDKTHFGFIAQDIIKNEEQNGLNDLAMITTGSSGRYRLDKEEIIALNTWQIQKLKKEVNMLKEEINKLKKESDK